MSGYVAGQARIPDESAPKMGGASDVTFVWEKDVIHAVWQDRPSDAKGQTTAECGRAVFRSSPSEWPPALGTSASACPLCLAVSRMSEQTL